MATDVERLMIRLEANASKFEREMDRARGISVKSTREIERNFEKLNAGVARAVAPIAATLAGVFSANEMKKAADTYTRSLNQLRVAGVGAGEIPAVFDQLFQSAQKNAVPIESLAQLYGRVSQAQTTLKASSTELLGLTEIVAQSLRVSGSSAEEASGALLQLAQALSGGKVQAEEYNSLLDGMYPLLQAAAAGIKEAGGDVAKLTALVKDGKVSSEAFFRGIQAGSSVLQDKLAGASLTVAQATTQMNNEFVRAVGEYDKLTGASGALAAGLSAIAGSLTGIAQTAAAATNAVAGLVNKLGDALAKRSVLDRINSGGAISPEEADFAARTWSGQYPQNSRMGLAIDRALQSRRADFLGSERSTRDDPVLAPYMPLPPPRPAENKVARAPISLANYKVPGDDDKGGRNAGSSRERLNEYEREIEQLRKKTELLDAEAAAIGRGSIEVERSKTVRELELAAKKAGIELTPAVKEAIEKEASAYAAAKQAVESKNKALEDSKKLQEFIGANMASFFSDIVSGGKNASDALMSLTKRLADAALQAALLGQGPLASLFGTQGANGGVGGIIGSLFRGFGGAAVAGGAPLNIIPGLAVGTSNVPRDMLANIHRGEMVIPKYDADLIRKGGAANENKFTIVQNMQFSGQQNTADLVVWGERVKRETLALMDQRTAQRGFQRPM